MTFEVEHRAAGSAARAGRFTTDHGTVETPVFMPVGTAASVKGIFHRDLADAGARIILANTYHLYLRPGMEVIEAAGGVHRFCTWDKPMLTDSGGFQVFSLAVLGILAVLLVLPLFAMFTSPPQLPPMLLYLTKAT